jgi:hypothetical protein
MDKEEALKVAFQEGFEKEAQGVVGKTLGLSDDVVQGLGRQVRGLVGKTDQQIANRADDMVRGKIPHTMVDSPSVGAAPTNELDEAVNQLSSFDADTFARATANEASNMRSSANMDFGGAALDAGALTLGTGGILEGTGATDIL